MQIYPVQVHAPHKIVSNGHQSCLSPDPSSSPVISKPLINKALIQDKWFWTSEDIAVRLKEPLQKSGRTLSKIKMDRFEEQIAHNSRSIAKVCNEEAVIFHLRWLVMTFAEAPEEHDTLFNNWQFNVSIFQVGRYQTFWSYFLIIPRKGPSPTSTRAPDLLRFSNARHSGLEY